MQPIYKLKTLRNILDAKLFQVLHFRKFISIWRKYKRNYDFPILFQIQTVNRCNADCQMCPYSTTTAQNSLMQMEQKLFKRLIDEIGSRNNVELIVLSLQNEPLVDKRIVDRAKYIKTNAPNVKLELVSIKRYAPSKYFVSLILNVQFTLIAYIAPRTVVGVE